MERFERRPQEEAAIRGEEQGMRGIPVEERLEKYTNDARELLNDHNARLGRAAERLASSSLEGTDLVEAAQMEVTELLGRGAEYAPEALAQAAMLIREESKGSKH